MSTRRLPGTRPSARGIGRQERGFVGAEEGFKIRGNHDQQDADVSGVDEVARHGDDNAFGGGVGVGQHGADVGVFVSGAVPPGEREEACLGGVFVVHGGKPHVAVAGQRGEGVVGEAVFVLVVFVVDGREG